MTYLVGLHLDGKRVLVAGGGGVGARRAVALAREGAQVVVVAPEAVGAIRAAASRGEMIWHQRTVIRSDLAGAWLAMAAVPTRPPQLWPRA